MGLKQCHLAGPDSGEIPQGSTQMPGQGACSASGPATESLTQPFPPLHSPALHWVLEEQRAGDSAHWRPENRAISSLSAWFSGLRGSRWQMQYWSTLACMCRAAHSFQCAFTTQGNAGEKVPDSFVKLWCTMWFGAGEKHAVANAWACH